MAYKNLGEAIGRTRIRLLIVALITICALGSILRWSGPARAQAQSVSVSPDAILNKLAADVPGAISTPPAPCATQPGPNGTCPKCVSSVPGASAYENGLPVPTPAPGFDYVVQLVNESNVTILGTANAANQGSASPGGPVPTPIAVEPREGTWVMLPKGAPNNGNILTIDIPLGWEGTQCSQSNASCGANGPRFYPRTGCKYDIAHNLAQCETGSCGDAYDCGMQALRNPPLASAGRAPVSIVEWTFNSQGGQGFEFPDISLVDGVSLTTDVQALGPHCESKPGAPTEPNWLSQNQPLAIHGADLREASRCMPSFQLTRGEVGQIIQGEGNPDDVVACFTNCGRYEYPSTPGAGCDPTTDPLCKNWLAFCCFTPPGDPNHVYSQTCTNSDQCEQSAGCWDNHNGPAKCACRAYIKKDTCPANVCTHPNPPDYGSQPMFGHCSDVTSDPTACIGDDTVHSVFPGAYTWPNDPQTYSSDARSYRIIFAPGGIPKDVATTDSGPIPSCGSFPEAYGYDVQRQICAGNISAGALFAGAVISPSCTVNADCPIIPGSNPPARYGCDPQAQRCATWSCDIAPGGPVSTGAALCSWMSPSATPTTGIGGAQSPTPTASPTPGASVTSKRISTTGAPGTTVDAGTFTVHNNLAVAETISSATISVSHPSIFSSMTLSGGGQSATTNPPTSSTTFSFGTPIAIPGGGSVTLSLSAAIATGTASLDSPIKYASLPLSDSSPLGTDKWPWAGGLMLLGVAPLGLPGGRRRRAIMMTVLALGLAVAWGGCGNSNDASSASSSQQVTAVAISANGSPVAVGGLPARLGSIGD